MKTFLQVLKEVMSDEEFRRRFASEEEKQNNHKAPEMDNVMDNYRKSEWEKQDHFDLINRQIANEFEKEKREGTLPEFDDSRLKYVTPQKIESNKDEVIKLWISPLAQNTEYYKDSYGLELERDKKKTQLNRNAEYFVNNYNSQTDSRQQKKWENRTNAILLEIFQIIVNAQNDYIKYGDKKFLKAGLNDNQNLKDKLRQYYDADHKK
jgi:hypothetical protein